MPHGDHFLAEGRLVAEENKQSSSKGFIDLGGADLKFTSEVKARSGVDVGLCWHCKTCVNGCPFSEAMDYAPNAVLRFVQLGLKKEALSNSTIWICVGCNTCSIQCPNAIDVAAVNDVLREMAIEQGIAVAEPDILKFHEEVLNSIRRYGRTHKLEIMLRYKAYRHDWFGDLGVGLRMIAKRKLDLLPSKSPNIQAIRKLFEQEKVA
jgi:heterodisulfide reductase subunit C